MKKALDYLYIFSKLSTSFILLACILVLGYFFYAGFKNQENSKNDQLQLLNILKDNTNKISQISKKISTTDEILDEIKLSINNSSKTNTVEEMVMLNKKVQELYLMIESISLNMEKIQSPETSNDIKINTNESSNIVLNKNKMELAKLVTFKFENNLDYSEELNILENLNDQNKKYIFEKINITKLKNFRGNDFVKNVFSQEMDFFIKESFKKNSNNIISKSLLKLVDIKPSRKNIIKNNEINLLNELSNYIDQKNYKNFYQKIITINNYEKYFNESIDQIKIAIEFEELLQKVS